MRETRRRTARSHRRRTVAAVVVVGRRANALEIGSFQVCFRLGHARRRMLGAKTITSTNQHHCTKDTMNDTVGIRIGTDLTGSARTGCCPAEQRRFCHVPVLIPHARITHDDVSVPRLRLG